jgi:hypothetical protein
MKPHRDPYSFLSSQQLLEELGNFIALESGKNDSPWVRVTKISNLFYEKYGVSPEEAFKSLDSRNSLRNFLTNSERFLIYGTPVPQEYYVALSQLVIPSCDQFRATSIPRRRHRPQRIDSISQKILEMEGTEEIRPHQTSRIAKYQTISPSEIQSIADLEAKLIEIAKSLIGIYPRRTVTLSEVSQKFYEYYKQPVRTIIRNVGSEIKLIELLQTIPGLCIQKVNNEWQITIETPSIE